ncbi:MAG: class I SAM-dependent methyltransferase [Thermoanaerobaculia bacterium]
MRGKRGETDAESAVAEEIRRGIDEAGTAGALPPSSRVWDRAERFVVPSVEPGASFPRLKKMLLRLLRVVTRGQGTFNTIVLEEMREIEDAVSALVRESSRRTRTVDRLREDFAQVRKDLDRIGHEYDIIHARFSAAERMPASRAPEPSPPAAAAARFPDGFYLRFEEEFRGPEEAIRARQRAYVDFFRSAVGPVLDCGCGRGEFLGVLKESGIASYGVDSNRIAVEMARARGVEAMSGDAFEHLRGIAGTLGGISALQLVEHLAPESVYEFLELCRRALSPGGRLLLETINPDSLYALRAFRLDPTHRWPVPASTLDLMAREVGFSEREIRWLSPVPPEETLEEKSENDRKVNRWLFGPQDYALLAALPRS